MFTNDFFASLVLVTAAQVPRTPVRTSARSRTSPRAA